MRLLPNNSNQSSPSHVANELSTNSTDRITSRRNLHSLSNFIENTTETFSFESRQPPPSYWASYGNYLRQINPQSAPLQRHPISESQNNNKINIRSRVEQYRNRISLSESESDEDWGRRSRILSPRRSNQNVIRTEASLDDDIFCPDIVRNCKSLPVDNVDRDYKEIENFSNQLSLHNEVGLPGITDKLTQLDMGHNLSIRRPKISLTWVLRDQQNQPSSSQQKKSLDWKQTEKILFRKPKEKLFSEKYVNDNNVKDEHGMKVSVDSLQANLNDVAKSERARKFREKLCGQRRSTESNYDQLEVSKSKSLSQANLSIKNTYSEPSIYITSAQSDSMALGKRYRRRRKRSPKFGYNIKNVDDFLSKCSLSNPANIPVVLSNSSILYQTRSGYHQIEIPLPLGMVVNSVFKNQNWLYVQTPHGEEGYVNFNACLPLGIIPNHKQNSSVNKPKPCWESNIDVFPSPCGNLTDSEKEVQLRGGTRSEGRRTPKLRRSDQSCSEKYLDSLYLKAASQPKTIDHSYAQLKPTNMCTLTNYNNFDKLNGDYVQLKHNRDKINLNTRRQVLLAITENFASDMIQVSEGDIVSLLAYKEYQESGALRQWYFIRNSEGFEGYIPSSITNEFL